MSEQEERTVYVPIRNNAPEMECYLELKENIITAISCENEKDRLTFNTSFQDGDINHIWVNTDINEWLPEWFERNKLGKRTFQKITIYGINIEEIEIYIDEIKKCEKK